MEAVPSGGGGGARACVLPGRERRAPSLVRAEEKMGGDGAKLVQPLVCLTFSLGKREGLDLGCFF